MSSSNVIRWGGLAALLGGILEAVVVLLGTCAGFLNEGTTWGLGQVWVPPASNLLRPLLTFASPHGVYRTYDGIWTALLIPLFAGLLGFYAYRRAGESRFGRLEKVGLFAVGLSLLMIIVGNGSESWFAYLDWFGIKNFAFLSLSLPALPIILIGSLLLGVGLLRSRAAPHTATILLIVGGFPGGIAMTLVIGHLLGATFLFAVAWAILGYTLRANGIERAVRPRPAVR